MIDRKNSPPLPPALVPVEMGTETARRVTGKLPGAALFADLTRSEIDALAGYLGFYTAAKDDAIYVEGQYGGLLSVVLAGRLKIVKDSGKGRSRVIAEVGPGKSLGEMSVLDGQPHSATVIVAEPVTLAVLRRDDLIRILREQPGLGAKLLWKLGQMLSLRLRKTSDQLVDFLDRPV